MNVTACPLDRIGVRRRTVADRIDRIMRRATEDDILAGKAWYAAAMALARELADESALTYLQASAVISHLSPRVRWDRNKAAARELIYRGRRMTGIMSGPFDRAMAASVADDPMATFGPKAHKTRAFAANIAGDLNQVTVDVWIARAVGVTEAQLNRVGVYDAIAHQFRLAAKRWGMEPAMVQAIVWIVVRGSAK